MTFSINGIDFSGYIQTKVGITETPRRIEGPHSGTALLGTAIVDYVDTKYDISVRVKPLPDNMVKTLLDQFAQAYVTLIYTSVLTPGDVRRILAIPSPSTVRYLTQYAESRIYGDLSLELAEK